MRRIGKSFALILILIIAISSVSLLMAYPAYAQIPPKPAFSISTDSHTNTVPTTYSTDPYTGTNITNFGYSTITFNVTLTIQNTQPTTAYLLEVKGHYNSNWYNPNIDDYNVTAFASSGSQTVITLYGSNGSEAGANQIFLQYGGHWGIDLPFGGQLDFRLQSVSGETPIRVLFGYAVLGNVSDWSQVQTETIPDYSNATTIVSPSPTPTVPEFPSWASILLLTSMVGAAGLLVYFKKHKPNQFSQ